MRTAEYGQYYAGKDKYVTHCYCTLTVIHAINLAKERIPRIRLLFMGAKHPNPNVPEMKMAVQARKLVRELELENYVLFNEDWVDYADRHNYLLDADITISAHLPGIETDFSFRTRMLDYVWAQRPIVCTEGDFSPITFPLSLHPSPHHCEEDANK